MLKKREIEYIQSNWQQYFDEPPFNCCDRLCEECRFTFCCPLYYDEKKWRLKVLRQGKDPDDPKIAFEQIRDSLVQTTKLLKKMAKEDGIDLNEINKGISDDYISPLQPQKIPLCRDSEKWLKMAHRVFKKIVREWKKYSLLEDIFHRVSKIEHYAFMVPTKFYRAMLYFYEKENKCKDEEERKWAYEDAARNACLGLCALKFCNDIFRTIAEKETVKFGWQCAKIISLGQKLEEDIKKRFPDVEAQRAKIIFNSL